MPPNAQSLVSTIGVQHSASVNTIKKNRMANSKSNCDTSAARRVRSMDTISIEYSTPINSRAPRLRPSTTNAEYCQPRVKGSCRCRGKQTPVFVP